MLSRNLSNTCFDKDYGKQMRFIAGPRQVGKTTLVKNYLKENKQSILYFNWDFRDIRLAYQKDPDFFTRDILNISPPGIPWVCFDEIHKYPKWKDILKEAYDKYNGQYNFVITGSARLDLFRKAGDSLAGRYFLFKLLPLTLNEITNYNKPQNDNLNSAIDFIEKRLSNKFYKQKEMESLLRFSGFPDPFISQSNKFHNKWKLTYIDKLIYDDIRAISQVSDLENISQLLLLLPLKVGSPLSINSLRTDIFASHNALKNYINVLELAYLSFMIKPFSKNLARSITKEKKLYFFDWTNIENPAIRFENYVAVELKALTEFWNDLGHNFSLYYLRTKDGKESDFLISKNNQPWLIIEVKSSKQIIENHHYKNAEKLGNIPVVQLIKENNIAEKHEKGYQISASRFF